MRKIFILFLMLAISLFGCSRGDTDIDIYDEAPPGVLIVGYAQVGAESAWRLANTASFFEAFGNSPQFDFRFVDSQNNPALQHVAVYDFIAQEVDYIIIAPIEEYGWDEILEEARDAGIPVIISDRMIETADDSLYVFWIGANFLQEGIDAMDWLNNYLISIGRDEESLNVFHMQGTLGSSAQIGRTQGINMGIAENDNLILKERRTGDFTLERGAEVMDEWLQNYSVDEIDILIAENDDMAFGAIRTMQEAGLRPGQDVIIISFDAGRNAVQAVADGLINATIECNPLHGSRVRENIELLEAGILPEKRQYVHTGMIFDATNAAREVENRW
jgi:simple sugar transport system substrate-binding protein